MSSLHSLFPEGVTHQASGAAAKATMRATESERLESLFSKPRTAERAASTPPEDTRALQSLVGGRARTPTVGGGGGAAPTRIRRVGSRVDVFNVVSAILAVCALVAATIVAVVVYSSRSPEAEAMRTLSQSEAVLANDTQGVNTAIARVAQSRTDGAAYAQQLELPLAQLAGMTDAAALADAEKARTDYLAAVQAVTVPEPLVAPAVPQVDPKSLASIGAAIDAVTVQSGKAAAMSDQVDKQRAQLLSLDRTMKAAMATFATTVPLSAATIVKANAGAKKSLRDAVTATADAVALSGLADTAAIATLPAYSTSVLAVRGDRSAARSTQPVTPASPSPAPSSSPSPTPPAAGGGGNG